MRMLREPPEHVEARAGALAARLAKIAPPGAGFPVVGTRAPVGGGSVPGFELPSSAVVLDLPGWRADELARALRRAPTPVLARVEDARVFVDARTLLPGDDDAIEMGASGALRRQERNA